MEGPDTETLDREIGVRSPGDAADLVTPEGEVAPEELKNLRVLIAHDWLVTWAGSERCIEQILRIFPDADLVVGVLNPHVRELNEVTRRARETWLGRLPGARKHHRWFLPLEGPAFASLDTSKYDLIISSSHAFSKAVRPARHAVHVCYCHSPPRYIWDLSESYRRNAPPLERFALSGAVRALRWLDRWSAQGVHSFICNARHIADRVQRCYGRDADVVYPPVAAKPFHEPGVSREGFLLSLGRLVPYKRVDLAIRAAEQLGVRLVVAGDGPDRARLERLAGPRTEFVGAVSEREAARLLSTCAAFMFCANEDFGIAPVEANAHGTPVVGFARGGLLETMREGVTAEFFREQTVESVMDAIRRALCREWDSRALQANAERFSPANFRAGLLRHIRHAVAAQTSSSNAAVV